jgi:hypothetical protein
MEKCRFPKYVLVNKSVWIRDMGEDLGRGGKTIESVEALKLLMMTDHVL